jgi:flagellar biosynthesis regulator FlbT
MHHRLLAEESKGILLKENQSTNKTQLYFFVMVVLLPTAGVARAYLVKASPT